MDCVELAYMLVLAKESKNNHLIVSLIIIASINFLKNISGALLKNWLNENGH